MPGLHQRESAHEQPLDRNKNAENGKDQDLGASGSVEARFDHRAQGTFNHRVQEARRCARFMPTSDQRDRQIRHPADSFLRRQFAVQDPIIGTWVESDGRLFLKYGQLQVRR